MEEWLEKQRVNPDHFDDDLQFSEGQSLMGTKKSDKADLNQSLSGSPNRRKPHAQQHRALTREELIEIFEGKLTMLSFFNLFMIFL